MQFKSNLPQYGFHLKPETVVVAKDVSCNWSDLITFKTGTFNDRMFPNRPKVSQMVFLVLQKRVCLIWSCPKNYTSVRMSKGNLSCQESLRWLFRKGRRTRDQETVSYCFYRRHLGDEVSGLKLPRVLKGLEYHATYRRCIDGSRKNCSGKPINIHAVAAVHPAILC